MSNCKQMRSYVKLLEFCYQAEDQLLIRELKIFVVIAAVAAFVACTQTASNSANTTAVNAKPVSNITPGPAPTTELASGAELYKTSCSKCHREDGTGGKITVDGKQMSPDDLTTAKINAKPDDKLTKYIVEGFPEEGMPPFKDKLKEAEIKAIISYIRTDLNKSGSSPLTAPAK